MSNMARIMFAAPKSGSGKTLAVCGIIGAMKKMKISVSALKCGPDYIDPMFHRSVLGIESGNIDTFFTDFDTTRYILKKSTENGDITVIEGVMGYYDGLGGSTERGSTYEVAKVTETPVVLIIDSKGASLSLAAVIKGLMSYRNDSNIRGVILNRMSAAFYSRIKEVIEKECGIRVLGYIPDVKELTVPSRHLGLVTPDEIKELSLWTEKAAEYVKKTVDINGIIEIAEGAEEYSCPDIKLKRLKNNVKIAIARDEAFSFYYAENIQLLKEVGAEIEFFSPIHDSSLPKDIDGIILWGGYPEEFTRALEKNEKIKREIYNSCKNGMPCIAECGGFLYLQRELEGTDGYTGKMVGLFDGKGFNTGKLCRFGYTELEGCYGGIFGERGTKIKAHEFHYWDCTVNGDGFKAKKPLRNNEYKCMEYGSAIGAGFPHIYYYSNIEILYSFLEKCERYAVEKSAKAHWDSIAKPIDSLGQLESIVVKLCGIYGSADTPDISKKALLCLCGDHGVVAEGVTQTGSEVTKIVAENFAKGCSTVNYMAGYTNTDVFSVDLGIDCESYSEKSVVTGVVIDRKIGRGTKNLALEPAMTIEECRRAVETGIELVADLRRRGYKIIATGEMGIGNTTPTTALAVKLLGCSIDNVVGKGAGLSKEGIEKKADVIRRAVSRIENTDEPLEIMAEIGGYEIAGLMGVFLGGLKYRIPIVIDGAISGVAALAAYRIDKRAADFMLASHSSKETVCSLALNEMGLKAVIDGEMCLGEGTGAVALFPLIDMAINVYGGLEKFGSFSIEPYKRFEDD